MKKTLMLWLLLMAGVVLLSICLIRPPAWATPEQSAAHLQPQPQPARVSLAQAAYGESASAAGAPHITLQADTPSSDNCITCHTDKKKLKKLATEPEEVKSEAASGEG